ncbi:hypothetical protein BDB01DRAFT_854301 [Pilobolus umbonatus]|nr:hypothetical protein BDB01DRAFT_854301 [Pilobolus umbonatus]
MNTLITLLNSDDTTFIKEITQPLSSIQPILSYFLDHDTQPATDILHYLFLVYERTTHFPYSPSPLFDPPVFLRFLVLTGESNRETLRSLASSWIDPLQTLLPHLQTVIRTLLHSPPSEVSHSYVLAHTMDVLLSVFIPYFSEDLDWVDHAIQVSYDQYWVPVLKHKVDQDSSVAPYAYLIKQALVSSFDTLIKYKYIDRLSQHPEVMDTLSSTLLQYIEASGLDHESRPYAGIDAPLMVDWQLTFHPSDSLPPQLEFLQLSLEQLNDMALIGDSWEPVQSLLSSRKNVHDNDAFDIFSHPINQSNVYLGKKTTEDPVVDVKKQVLQRVIDMYDDEYDDSYDAIHDPSMEIPESVDTIQASSGHLDPSLQNESRLVECYMEVPDVFNRKSRTSAHRKKLKEQTGMTDEQLEGWAIMFNRNPRKDKILEKYRLFDMPNQGVDKKESTKQENTKSTDE